MRRRRLLVRRSLGWVLGAWLGAVVACSDDGAVVRNDPTPVCARDEYRACEGTDGCEGEQLCLGDRSGFGDCRCSVDDISEAGAGGMGMGGADGTVTGGASGAGGEPGTPCTASCDPSDVPVCADGARTFCLELVAGCGEPATIDCPSGFCTDELSCGVCPDQCDSPGDVACAKGGQRLCEADARGCLVWGDATQTCASGFCADDGQTCGTCDHECPTAGATECQGGQVRGCAVDPYGCRSWWFWSSCALGACADMARCSSGYSEGQRGSPLDDEPLALTLDRRGNLVMVGGYHAYDLLTGYRDEFDAHLYATGPTGSLEVFESWGAFAEPDEAVAIAVASDNSYVITGYTDGAMGMLPSRGGRDAFLARWSAAEPQKAAALMYLRQWGSEGDDSAASVALDRDDTAYVLGSTDGDLVAPSAGDRDLFLTRLDSAGNVLGTVQWGTPALDHGSSVLVDSQDNVIVAGHSEGALPGESSAGLGDAFVSRLNPDGSAAWTTQFGTAGDEQVAQMIFDRQGNLLVLGTTDGTFAGSSAAGGSDVFVAKLDASGTLLFSRQWGTSADDIAAALGQVPSGEIYAAITVLDAEQGCMPGQALLLKWNENATAAEPRLFDTCEAERATSLTVDPNGTVYMGGSTEGFFVDSNRGGSDIFLVTSQISN